jgi:cytidyltransferase-like protein
VLVLGEGMKLTTIYGLITGGFDPLHGGHMDYIMDAANHCDYLYIGLNSDRWLTRKKGMSFMNFDDRSRILSNLKQVKGVFSFNDDDETACEAINIMIQMGKALDGDNFVIRFMNGGDRSFENTPEQKRFGTNKNVEFLYGVGGGKRNSSSVLVKDAAHKLNSLNRVDRNWGYYEILSETKTEGMHTKLKKLVVNPGASLSMQYHYNRSELWFIAEGRCKLERQRHNFEILEKGSRAKINQHDWHRLINPTNEPVVVYEIQYGQQCEEEDIVRL